MTPSRSRGAPDEDKLSEEEPLVDVILESFRDQIRVLLAANGKNENKRAEPEIRHPAAFSSLAAVTSKSICDGHSDQRGERGCLVTVIGGC